VLWLDAGCNVGGYWSDFSRGAVVGGPSDAQRRVMDTINRITRTALDAIRPGIEVAAVGALAKPSRRNVGPSLDVGRL